MSDIIPEKSKKIVFEKVVMQSMENLVSEGDVSLFSYILNRHVYLYFLAKESFPFPIFIISSNSILLVFIYCCSHIVLKYDAEFLKCQQV